MISTTTYVEALQMTFFIPGIKCALNKCTHCYNVRNGHLPTADEVEEHLMDAHDESAASWSTKT